METYRKTSMLIIFFMLRSVFCQNKTDTRGQNETIDKINVIIIVTSSLAAVSSSIIVVFLVVSCIKRIRRQPQPNQQVVYIESEPEGHGRAAIEYATVEHDD